VPHAGELLSQLGTLRGEGNVIKRDNSLVVEDPHEGLTDELGNSLLDELLLELTD
jgi:hypothetical protein